MRVADPRKWHSFGFKASLSATFCRSQMLSKQYLAIVFV